MVRFIHTSDWQLGMTRHFLAPEAQARFTDSRIQAIRSIGDAAARFEAAFVVVAGDVFESNLVDRQLVLRALEAMKESACIFYLLPGNHDPLDAASVFRSPVFARNCPTNVVVLDGTSIEAAPGVTLLNAPWRSKKMTDDAIAGAYGGMAATGQTIVVGHGQAEPFAPDLERADIIRMAPLEAAIAAGNIHYVALGDRHSRTAVGASERVWYSGAPEPTDYDEDDPGQVLCVEIDGDDISVSPSRVGTWKFLRTRASIDETADIHRLRAWFEGLPAKDRTILKLGFEGTVSLSLLAELEGLLEHVRPMFAAIERRDRDSDLVVLPSDMDFSELGLSGFASLAARDLADAATVAGPEAVEARDALGLLFRLVRGAA